MACSPINHFKLCAMHGRLQACRWAGANLPARRPRSEPGSEQAQTGGHHLDLDLDQCIWIRVCIGARDAGYWIWSGPGSGTGSARGSYGTGVGGASRQHINFTSSSVGAQLYAPRRHHVLYEDSWLACYVGGWVGGWVTRPGRTRWRTRTSSWGAACGCACSSGPGGGCGSPPESAYRGGGGGRGQGGG